MFSTILHVVQVLSALALIGIILIQQGKGASMGAAFGAGASSTVFGARGAGSVLTRMTTIIALVFFSVSFYMSYLSAHRAEARSIVEQAVLSGGGVIPQGDAAGGTGDASPAAPATAPADDLPALPTEALPFPDTPADTGAAPASSSAAAPADAAAAVPAGVEATALPPAEADSGAADTGAAGDAPAP